MAFEGDDVPLTAQKWLKNSTLFSTVFAPKHAELAVVDGYLSEGIRISIEHLDNEDSFSQTDINKWAASRKDSYLCANPTFALFEAKNTAIGDGYAAKRLIFYGRGKVKGKPLSQPEQTVVYFTGSSCMRARVELTMPSTSVDRFEYLKRFVEKSLLLSL